MGTKTMLTAAIFCMPAFATLHADIPYFMGLGDLPGGSTFSSARAVSSDGRVVVGDSFSDSGEEAFVWSYEPGMVGLGDLAGGAFFSQAYAVSADGSVVVGRSESTTGDEAFRWESGTITGLGALEGHTLSRAFGVSDDGSVVVGRSWSPEGPEACAWSQAGCGVLGWTGAAKGISADGSVVVGTTGYPTEAVRWTASDGAVGLGDLPGGLFLSDALAISDDGSIVVGYSQVDWGEQAFRWTQEEGMVGLGTLGGWQGAQDAACAVSADGSVIVGHSSPVVGEAVAFIWDPSGGMRSLQGVLEDDLGLDLTGWLLHHATGVSADGRTIVGTGENPSGSTEAWIVHIPEPATLSLFCLGGLAFSRRRR